MKNYRALERGENVMSLQIQPSSTVLKLIKEITFSIFNLLYLVKLKKRSNRPTASMIKVRGVNRNSKETEHDKN